MLKIRKRINERIFFLLLALAVGGLLALRPIPRIYEANDTGRYVDTFNLLCANPILKFGMEDMGMSRLLFNAILRPICWTGQPAVFLFVTALFVPFAFLLFGKWRKGALAWSLAALFSISVFEFSTNALRQGMRLLFFFFAVKLILDDKILIGLLIGVFAIIIHASNLGYFPLLLWFAKLGYKKHDSAPKMVLFVVLPSFIILVIAIISVWILASYVETYKNFYEVGSSPEFLIFTALPVYYIYAVRKKFASPDVSSDETTTMVYSSLLMLGTFFFFPAIVYRVAFTACALQIFMAMSADNSNSKQGIYALGGMILQLGIYIALSPYPMQVLFG